MASRRPASTKPLGQRKPPAAAPAAGSASSDRVLRLQIFLAFVVPLLLLGAWLGSKGFFQTP